MREIDIGLMFSTTGPYAALGCSARDGAVMALEEVNACGALRLVPVMGDAGGIPSEYERLAGEMVANGAVRHIVGGITSWSRKDMIPVLERHAALLWYPCPYEGFECNDHVVYLGACPNQHLVPLVDHMLALGTRRAFLVGSNYVWGWETLRVARERLSAGGVRIGGERFVPLGEIDVAHIIDEIAAEAPDLIVNSLIGPSNHAFMRAFAASTSAEVTVRVVSANQTEADIAALGGAAEGLMSMCSWFESVPGPEMADFRARIAARYGAGYRASSFFATAYAAVQLLAEGLIAAGTQDPRAVFAAIAGRPHRTVLGRVEIDPVNRHTSLIPRLAELRGDSFRILADSGRAVPPDPYLTHVAPVAPRRGRADGRPNLKVVR